MIKLEKSLKFISQINFLLLNVYIKKINSIKRNGKKNKTW